MDVCVICENVGGSTLVNKDNRNFHISCLSDPIEDFSSHCLKKMSNFELVKDVISKRLTAEEFYSIHLDKEMDRQILNWAIQRGDIELFKELFGRTNFKTAEFTTKAALYGQLEIMSFLFFFEVSCASDAIDIAAQNGHIQIIRYLINRSFSSTVMTIKIAAANGHFDIVQYLIENSQPCNFKAVDAAAASGHLHIVQYLTERGFFFSILGITDAIRGGHLEVVRCLQSYRSRVHHIDREKVIDVAVESGNFEMVEFFCPHPWCYNANLDIIARDGHLNILRHFMKAGCIKGTSDALDLAAQNGYVEIVRCLLDISMPFTKKAIISANRNGHFEIIDLLLNFNKPGGIKPTFPSMNEFRRIKYPRHPEDYSKYNLHQYDLENYSGEDESESESETDFNNESDVESSDESDAYQENEIMYIEI